MHSHHRFTFHSNLVTDNFPPRGAKITYLPTVSGNTYLSLVSDTHSRKMFNYQIDDNMKEISTKQAFYKVLSNEKTSVF